VLLLAHTAGVGQDFALAEPDRGAVAGFHAECAAVVTDRGGQGSGDGPVQQQQGRALALPLGLNPPLANAKQAIAHAVGDQPTNRLLVIEEHATDLRVELLQRVLARVVVGTGPGRSLQAGTEVLALGHW